MGRKVKPAGRGEDPARRVKVTVSLDPETARTLKAYSAYHRRELSSVVAEGVRHLTRGFRAYQLPPESGGGGVGTIAPADSTAPATVQGHADGPQALRVAG